MQNRLLEDPVGVLMVRLSLPAILGMVLFGVNQLVDAVFVGRFVGETALAGVSISLPVAQLFLGLGAMVGGGAGAMLSIALGRRDEEELRSILPAMNLLTLELGGIMTVATLVLATPLVRMMGGDGELLSVGVAYLRTIAIAATFQIWGLGGNFVVRSEGKLGLAMSFAATGLLANIALNYLFIGVFGWGVAGAAWATNAGMAVYSLCHVAYFQSGKASFEPRFLTVGFHPEVLGRIVALGAPALIFQVMALIQQLTIFRLIARYGTVADTALFGAAFRVFFAATLPIVGMQRALQPIVGQNYGAGLHDRVRRTVGVFLAAMLGISVALWAVAFTVPEFVLASMLPGRSFDTMEIADFRLFMTVTTFLPVPFVALTYFPAIGSGGIPAALALARQVFVFVPVAVLWSRAAGVGGVYRALFWTDVAVAIIAGWVMVRDLRRRR